MKLDPAIARYKEFRDTSLDDVLLKINKGRIKAGRYAGRIKIDKNFKIGKEFEFDGSKGNSKPGQRPEVHI